MKFDQSQLDAISRRLAAAIFAASPEARQDASMERGDEADGLSEHRGESIPGFQKWLDLRSVDAVATELTGKYSPGRALLRVMVGSDDRQVEL